MSARSLLSAMRPRPRARCAGPSPGPATCPRRQFGSTPPACAIRASFAETDNELLNKDLKEIQECIIFPAYLPPAQRKIVFDPKKRAYLEQNPIVIEVEDQVHRFSPLDRFKDIRNSKRIFMDALEKMKTRRDWDNLATLLAGYKKAGIVLRADHWGKLARLAGTTGNIQAIVECAKLSDKTGLTLANREITVRVFVHINENIVDSGRDKEATLKALRQCEFVLDLLNRPEHALAVVQSRSKLQFSRLVRGMILFARASAIKLKLRDRENVDKDMDLLRDDVTLSISLWQGAPLDDIGQVPELQNLNPTVEMRLSPNISKAPNGYTYMRALTLTIKGIALSRELVRDHARYLAPVQKALEAHLADFMETAVGRCPAWWDAYTGIMGRAPELPRPEGTTWPTPRRRRATASGPEEGTGEGEQRVQYAPEGDEGDNAGSGEGRKQ